jgi:hypothetical protein
MSLALGLTITTFCLVGIGLVLWFYVTRDNDDDDDFGRHW